MIARVFLILLIELGKSDKIRGLSSILSLFRNEFNNKGAGMLDFIFHVTLKLLKIAFFCAKTSRFCHRLHGVVMAVNTQVNH